MNSQLESRDYKKMNINGDGDDGDAVVACLVMEIMPNPTCIRKKLWSKPSQTDSQTKIPNQGPAHGS
jgi:hypothetical protein